MCILEEVDIDPSSNQVLHILSKRTCLCIFSVKYCIFHNPYIMCHFCTLKVEVVEYIGLLNKNLSNPLKRIYHYIYYYHKIDMISILDLTCIQLVNLSILLLQLQSTWCLDNFHKLSISMWRLRPRHLN